MHEGVVQTGHERSDQRDVYEGRPDLPVLPERRVSWVKIVLLEGASAQADSVEELVEEGRERDADSLTDGRVVKGLVGYLAGEWRVPRQTSYTGNGGAEEDVQRREARRARRTQTQHAQAELAVGADVASHVLPDELEKADVLIPGEEGWGGEEERERGQGGSEKREGGLK